MDLLGESNIWVVLILTVVLFGGAAYLGGQAVARSWQGVWLALVYTVLLALGHRFLVWALFEGELLTLVGLLFDWVLIVPFALIGFYLTRARKMVTQYPWLYERAGPFAWRDRAAPPPS